MSELGFLELFAGVGGLGLGLERAGIRCVGQVEIERSCREVLARHWPTVPRFDDVRDFGADELAGLGRIDLVVGGFPCQDVSVAGRRAGLAGERSGLWYEFHRVVALACPSWVVVENVPGLLSSNGGRDFAVILRGLVELGYGVAWRVLDAQHFGVAQRRRRVFVVGHLGEPWSAPASVLFESESCAGDSPPGREARKNVANTLGAGTAGGGWASDTDRMTFVPTTARGLVAGGNDKRDVTRMTYVPHLARALLSPASGYRSDGESETFIPEVAHTLRCESADASEDGTGKGTPILAMELQHDSVADGPGRTCEAGGKTSRRAEGFHLTQDPISSDEATPAMGSGGRSGCATLGVVAYGVSENQRAEVRLTAVSSLITTGGGKAGQGYPAVMADQAVRRLTPLECERLQGFPDGWTDGQCDAARYRQLGNAVAVPCGDWIGRRTVRFASRQPSDGRGRAYVQEEGRCAEELL